MERFSANCRRIYATKYSRLEEYERHVVQSTIAVAEFGMAKLGALGISLLPLLILHVEEWRPIHGFLFLWEACELWFLIYQMSVIQALKEGESVHWDSERRAAGIEKLLEHMGDPADSAEQLLKNWQLEKVKAKPCMAHFVNTLVWMFFNKNVNELTPDEVLESRVMLHKFKRKLNIPNSRLGEETQRMKYIRFSLDHLEHVNKPLIFYLVISVPRVFMLGYLWMRGFRVCADAGKNHMYWVKSGDDGKDPIIFSTGVGIGINGYVKIINDLICRYPQRTIILLETSCINLQPAASLLSETDSLCEIDDMFLALELDQCTWLGHSYGTIIAGWVVKHRPHYISKLVLVDPICFRVWDASSFRTIFYRPPDSLEAKLFQILFASDPTLACGFARHVNWFSTILFPEQITMPTQIFIAEHDFLLDHNGLHSYLNHRISKDNLSHINVTLMDALHGSFHLCSSGSRDVIAALRAE